MDGRLLLVIPPVVLKVRDGFEVDGDFANNLEAYARHFSHVTVACSSTHGPANSLSNTIPFKSVAGHERITYILLPNAYREDRYFRHYLSVRKLLRSEIDKADYLLFSPHASFDWPTLAARLALADRRSYDMEADWGYENPTWSMLSTMPNGPRKVKKYFLSKRYKHLYDQCMRGSSVALLQGQEVYDFNKDIAPNPHKVLNIQVSGDDYVSEEQLSSKIKRLKDGSPLIISYAGRAIEMKGPDDWLNSVADLVGRGVKLQAKWYGDGNMLDGLREQVYALGLSEFVSFPGKVDREIVMTALRESDIFMFCHKIPESPRCLVEALAAGSPIIGYGGLYARDLVAREGGGAFVEVGEWHKLADLVEALDKDRDRLADLMRDAFETAQYYDRDEAILTRIRLIKKYVKPPNRSGSTTADTA